MSTDTITKETAISVFRSAVHNAETLVDMSRRDCELRAHIAALAVDAGCTEGAVAALERRAEKARANLLELVRQLGDEAMRLEWAEEKRKEKRDAP